MILLIEHSPDFYQKEYDVYIEETPLEARFDPLTIQCLVKEAIPKHAAYDLSFEEYLEKRSALIEYDLTEKKRLTFYLPLYPALRSQDYAFKYKLSITRFLTAIIELGLICLQYDYHDDVNSIRECRGEMSNYLVTSRAGMLYNQIARHTISIDSAAGARNGKCKHFALSCPEWLYNTITEKASVLNMTISDLTYLCWCIGLQKCSTESIVDYLTRTNIENILDQFNFEIDILNKRITTICMELHAEGELHNHKTT